MSIGNVTRWSALGKLRLTGKQRLILRGFMVQNVKSLYVLADFMKTSKLTSDKDCEFAFDKRDASPSRCRIRLAPPAASTSSAFFSREGGSPTGRSKA
jgi:hypothetical protein